MRLLCIVVFVLMTTVATAAQSAREEVPVTPEAAVEALQNVVMDAMHGPVEEGDDSGTAAVAPAIMKANVVLQKAVVGDEQSDIRTDFDRARARLNDDVAKFAQAVDEGDSAAILAGMLRIHESMSRAEAALNGMCYELVLLHDAIAPIQHRALPDENWAAIKAALPVLKERVAALKTAELPAKRQEVKPELLKQTAELEVALESLEKACVADDGKAIAAAFSDVHDHFHSCVELFQ